MIRIPVIALAVVIVLAALSAARPAERALAECAFPFTPVTYEDLKDRRLFIDTINLAANNMLFAGDPFFGLPELDVGPRDARGKQPGKIPTVLLKAIGWIESSITQTAGNIPFGAIGPSLVSFDCGYGVAQVTSGMTIPLGENGRGSPQQALVASHYAYNIARGAAILAAKWNQAPEDRPIAGTDTEGSPLIIENWYFAVWSYNGFTGPGANRSNHPLDPIYGNWPRMGYSCGATGDGKGHNRANYPYQELVFGCAGNPPVVEGQQLWTPEAVSLPDLNNPAFRNPLGLNNFVFPYSRMDIPSPAPIHVDGTQPPDPALRDRVMGAPRIRLTRADVRVGFAPGSGSSVEVVNILNDGSGVLAWYAIPSDPWLTILPYTGAAVGGELPCAPNTPCERAGRMEISVDVTKVPPGRRTASIRVYAMGTDQFMDVKVDVVPVIRVGVPGITKN
jgi:hypothetical protein